jgi:thioredoxin-related protein
MFTKESCGPCGLVKKYINTLNDERSKIIEEVFLEDFSDIPIPQENIDLAKKYGVTATPVLVITDSEGVEIEKMIGGLNITQSIIKLYDKYGIT